MLLRGELWWQFWGVTLKLSSQRQHQRPALGRREGCQEGGRRRKPKVSNNQLLWLQGRVSHQGAAQVRLFGILGRKCWKRPKLINNWKIGDTDWSTKDEDRYCPSLSLWTRRWSAVTRPPEAVLQKLISRQICEMSRTALTFKSFVRVLYGRGLCWWMFLFLHDQGPNSSQTLE